MQSILYDSTRVSVLEPRLERTDRDSAYQTVHEDGELDKCVYVTPNAYDKILRLATTAHTKDTLPTYLKETWKRLMEQHRILNVKAHEKIKAVLMAKQISVFFAVFNTGLENKDGDEIYAVLVQSFSEDETPQPYTLFESGIILQSSRDIEVSGQPFIKYLKNILQQTQIQNYLIYHNKYLQNGLKIAIQEALKRTDSGTNPSLDRWTNAHQVDSRADTSLDWRNESDVTSGKGADYTNAQQEEDAHRKCTIENYKVVEEMSQKVSSYSTSLNLYDSTRVSSKCDGELTNLPETHQVVHKDGGFDQCVFVTDHAYDELKRLATNNRTCDRWTRESLHNYLKYTWIRLMEQHRIINAKAQNERVTNLLKSGGISKTFAVFNTGLANEDGEDIYALLVQTTSNRDDTSPPYTLFQSGITLQHAGIFITTDGTKQSFINYFKKELEDPQLIEKYKIYFNPDMSMATAIEKGFQRALFFKPRDAKLLLDWTADIECDINHIIKHRLDRFLEVGVIDEFEAFIIDEKPNESDIPFGELKHAKYFNKNKYILMHPKRSKEFYFRRGDFGINACSMLLDRWIEDAKKRVQGTFTLAVPQIYYHLNDSSQMPYYCGRLQLLIPLFCGTNKAKLALSIDLHKVINNGSATKTDDDSSKVNHEDSHHQVQNADSTEVKSDNSHVVKYTANTVLRIQWAYSNARLLAAPQATWILQPEDFT